MPEKLYQETYRPQFHFTARKNWLNDPNGLVYYKGDYHLFYQHNPFGNEWGHMTWGHAISPDLVHWQQLDDALKPDELGTMFSGSAVVDWQNTSGFQTGEEKSLVAIYTAAGNTSPESEGKRFTQCLAYSNDRGRAWTKYGGNPVLGPIAGDNRDPKVIWHAPSRRWIMTLYLEGSDFTFLASPDLKRWERLHDITVPGCDECPDFFPLTVEGDSSHIKWVWTAANGHYVVGDFDGKRFTPEGEARPADWGANFYAVQTYSDIPEEDGRRIQIAWMRGGSYPGMPFNQQTSFPCELILRRLPEGLRLCRWPVREIAALYQHEYRFDDRALDAGISPLPGVTGDLFDIQADIDPGSAAEVGIEVLGERVIYSAKDRALTCLGRSAPLEPVDGRVRLRVLADRTSLEVFGNGGRVSLTSCFLPAPEERHVGLYASGGSARIATLTAHLLRSAWKVS